MQIIIGVLLLMTGIAACTKDKGNYDYTSLNELTIEPMKAVYQVEQDSMLAISLTISGKDGFREDEYEYLWYAWQPNFDDYIPDTLSYEKDLNVTMSIPIGEYTLRYVVTEKATGVFYSLETDLSVINSYSKGVVALSRIENGESDVTFINAVNTVSKHVYKEVNGVSAGQNPQGIYYLGGTDGTKNVLLIASEDKAITVEPMDFSDYSSLAHWFYIEPEGIVEGMGTDGWNEYLIMDGKAYGRVVYPAANPTGMYDPKVKGEYELAPFILYGEGAFFYDSQRRCFLFYAGYGDMIVPEALGTAFNAADMQMDMLYGTAFDADMRAVMEDDSGKRYMISGLEVNDYDRETWEDIIQINALRKLEMTQPGAAEATCFTISSKDPDFLYYAFGNKIMCVSMITGNVLAEYTMDQPIDYLEFDQANNPDRLYVAVSDGSGTTDSGSIYFLQMASDGSLTQIEGCEFRNVCGQVVDFEYKP